ncbi:MAG TPA: hypothetical protein VGR16_09370, partial [Thermomicrobiales bacterium]|nr:hypothetical protein [Thermomicrobiales bacterium]
ALPEHGGREHADDDQHGHEDGEQQRAHAAAVGVVAGAAHGSASLTATAGAARRGRRALSITRRGGPRRHKHNPRPESVHNA